MRQISDILAYARQQAGALAKDLTWHESRGYGGYWVAASEQKPEVRARAVAALEFFRQFAGPNSVWTQHANEVFDKGGDNQSMETGARTLGDLLRAWADQVEAGIVEVAGARAWAEFDVVSTDIMAQVRRLLEDRQTHPAAAIVLCGAALEIALRAVVDARVLTHPPHPSISSYTQLLRATNLITVQDVKDFEQCGGLRNSAAHGQFDALSLERA